MSKEQVILDITAEGISVNTEGFQGKGCEAIHKAFSQLGKVTEHKKKPEYHKVQNTRVGASVRAGR